MKEQLINLLMQALLDKGRSVIQAEYYSSEIAYMLPGSSFESSQTMADELFLLSAVLNQVANQLK